jgi:hypothetical protein
MALAVVLSLHFGITPLHIMAADTCEEAKANIRNRGTIELFMDCLNTCVPADVSEAIQCLPDKCLITVTMSPQSAQRACTLGGCQLPRIILDCPGPADGLRFRPSFLLCPVDSKGAGDHFGKDRIEIGEDNRKLDRPIRTAFGTGTFDMKMADVPILPNNNYVSMDLEDVLSLKSGRGNVGSKGCNNCHDANGTTMVTDMFGQMLEAQLSLDISAFGVFVEGLAQYTIGTNDPIERMLRIGPGMTTKGSDGMLLQPVDVVRQGLSPICDCIKDPDKQTAIIADNDNRRNFPKNQSGRGLGDGTPNPDMRTEIGVMTRLCDALQAYTTGPRGVGNSSACGTAPGTSCSGVAGGGKFLQQGTAAVSILSLQVKGEVVHDSASAFSFTDIDGDVSAFDYGTRTYINPVHLSSLSGSLSGSGDLVVTGAGVAAVNGVSTNIHLNAAKMNGVVTFQILNADTGMPLAGGTGESGLAKLDFIIGAP